MGPSGRDPYHRTAVRLVARYLSSQGAADVRLVGEGPFSGPHTDVDVTYSRLGIEEGVKVKADPYIGTDQSLIDDRSRPYYRASGDGLALEVVADSATRSEGWVFDSDADHLYYYRLALDHTEEELDSLVAVSDLALLRGLKVMEDDLLVIPLAALRTWLSERRDDYAARPVRVGDTMAWHKLVPRRDVESGVEGVERVGSIFRRLA